MTELSRRQALAFSAIAVLATAMPVWAQDAATSGAAWDLSEIYPDEAAWDAARKGALAAIPGLKQYQGRLGESADTLAAALIANSDLGKTVSRVYVYTSLKADEDVRVSAWQEKQAQATDLYTALGEATAWMAPELLTVGKAKIDGFVAQNDVLKKRFAFFLANTLRQAPHTLSAEGEGILASATNPLEGPSEIQGQLRSSDIPWPTITLSDGKQVRLDSQGYTLSRDAPNRDDRKKVFDAFFGAHQAFKNTFGATYAANVKGDIFTAKARKYPTSLAAAIAPYNIPEAVYRTLVAETNKGLPQLHRYFELRRRMLKLPDMHYYDIYPPLVSLDRKFSLDQMRTLSMESFQPLGADYVARFGKASPQSGWIRCRGRANALAPT